MKFLFDNCIHDDDHGYQIKLGINWYKHCPVVNRRFKGWKGLTITFYLIKWQFHFTVVDDYKAYQHRMNYKSNDRLRNKNAN